MLETTDCAALPQPPLSEEEVCFSEFYRFVSVLNQKKKKPTATLANANSGFLKESQAGYKDVSSVDVTSTF